MIYNLAEIARLVAPILRRYPVSHACLFGSYARGEATDKSDVDIVLHLEEGASFGMFDLSGLKMDLCDALQKKVDLLTVGSVRASKNALAKNIDDEGVLIFDAAHERSEELANTGTYR